MSSCLATYINLWVHGALWAQAALPLMSITPLSQINQLLKTMMPLLGLGCRVSITVREAWNFELESCTKGVGTGSGLQTAGYPHVSFTQIENATAARASIVGWGYGVVLTSTETMALGECLPCGRHHAMCWGGMMSMTLSISCSPPHLLDEVRGILDQGERRYPGHKCLCSMRAELSNTSDEHI